MVTHQPENRIWAVLTLGKRRITRSLALGFWHAHLWIGKLQAVIRILFTLGNFFARNLAGDNWIKPLDALRSFTVSYCLYLKRMQLTESSNLIKRQSRIIDEPDGRCLRHKKLGGH